MITIECLLLKGNLPNHGMLGSYVMFVDSTLALILNEIIKQILLFVMASSEDSQKPI